MVDYMQTFRAPRIITAPDSYKHIIAFTQNDTYGDAGYNGFVTAYNTWVAPIPQPDSTMPNPSIMRLRYTREDVASVDAPIGQAEDFLTGVYNEDATATKVSVGVVMIDTYQPGNKFIRAIKDWLNADAARAAKLDVLFIHVSFVGSDALAASLVNAPDSYVDVTDPSGQRKKTYAGGVMVTQVVPYYQSQAPGITAYRADITKLDGGAYTFTSLEGYIAAKLFVAGLNATHPTIDDMNMVNAFNTQITNMDLGIGTLLNFTSTNHQASHTVWGSQITDDGKFVIPFIWDPASGITPGST